MTKPSQWKKTEIDTQDLFLDDQNWRFPPHLHGLAQPQLLEALIDEYDVYEIASSIEENGFYPHESLVVVLEKGKYIVLEGNRRLAACKALLQPEKLSDSNRTRFTKLSAATDKASIKKMSVVIAPLRADAIDLIESLHTTPGRLKWDPISKYRFNQAYRSNNKAKFTEANKALDAYLIAKALDLPEEIKKIVLNEKKFYLTNLLRIMDDENTMKYLGYSYDHNGKLIIKSKGSEFQKGFTPIVTDVVTSKSFSRMVNSVEDKKKYITDKKREVNLKSSGSGHLTAEQFVKQLQKGTSITSVPTKGSGRSKATSKGLIPMDFDCTIKETRIQSVFGELQRMPVIKYANAVGISLRLLLELSLFKHLDSIGEIAKMKAEAHKAAAKKGQNLTGHWTPELKKMLKWISDPATTTLSGHLSKKIADFIDQKSEDPVLYNLNQLVHNPEEIPDETSLRKTWSSLQGLLKITLNPSDGTKP
ncbi:MAG: hypothetical protein JNJ75_17385 [Cyclobacteriaceae bacterium]|nr:hypothetical protein [Cyclobacteriaceae bacterium]